MNIFTIIVTYNGMRWYDRCLGSLRNSETPTSVVVIDNASTDGSAEYIKERFPEVHLIESKENLGFAKANNIGMRKALDDGADYVFLLNQDAWVEKNTLKELVKTFQDNGKVGIAAPVHLNGAYSELDLKFAQYMGSKFTSDAYMHSIKPYYEVSFVNAAAWLISRLCLETVGGFDTLLFRHYGEDNNYCQRIYFHGFRIIVNTACTICHDRESLQGDHQKYLTISSQTPFYELRKKMGDVNQNINIDKEIQLLKRKKIRRILTGQLKGIKQIDEQISNWQLIGQSRQQNRTAGTHWL